MSERTRGQMGVAPAEASVETTAARPVVLISSPRAGRSAKGAAALATLQAAGVTLAEELPVGDLDRNLPLGSAWRERGYVAAVAAGGDGTIGAVASQLAGSGLPLGILPLGTSNDTARSLGVPLDLSRAAEVIARGVPVPVDAGQVTPAATAPFALAHEASERAADYLARIAVLAPRGAYFLHALTLGLNAAFARLATDIARRQRWGRFTYAASAVEALTQFEPVRVTLRLTGVGRWSPRSQAPDAAGNLELCAEVIQLAAVNLPVFGGELDLRLPGVEAHDHLLDFMLIEVPASHSLRAHMEAWLETARSLGRKRQASGTTDAGMGPADLPTGIGSLTLPGVHRYQARAAIIETPAPVDITLDGEIRSRTPARVQVAPESVHILLPPAAVADVRTQSRRTRVARAEKAGKQT
jgi:diacylglycerol kinase family enzyme